MCLLKTQQNNNFLIIRVIYHIQIDIFDMNFCNLYLWAFTVWTERKNKLKKAPSTQNLGPGADQFRGVCHTLYGVAQNLVNSIGSMAQPQQGSHFTREKPIFPRTVGKTREKGIFPRFFMGFTRAKLGIFPRFFPGKT